MTPEQQAVHDKREALREADDRAFEGPPMGFLLWTIWLAFAAAIMLGRYALVVFFVTFGPCPGGMMGFPYAHGGPAKTLTTAAVIAGVLWVAAALVGWRFPYRHRRVFLAYAGLYVVALVVLWEIAPAVWGKGVCT